MARRSPRALAVIAVLAGAAAVPEAMPRAASAQPPSALPRARPDTPGTAAAPPSPITPPLPRREPGRPAPADPVAVPRPDPGSGAARPRPAEDCIGRLRGEAFVVEAAEVAPAGDARCRIDTPVRLLAAPVPTEPGTVVRFPDEPVLACAFAEAVGRFAGELAAPLAAGGFGGEVVAIRTGPGYDCRRRNRAAEGKLSAHAAGSAIDVAGFELDDGRRLEVAPGDDRRAAAVVAAIRRAACGWFTTVLGPGSDAAHAGHLHLDTEPHGGSGRYRICE
jgi:hypothetical protein